MQNFSYLIHKKPFLCTNNIEKESLEEYLVAKAPVQPILPVDVIHLIFITHDQGLMRWIFN